MNKRWRYHLSLLTIPLLIFSGLFGMIPSTAQAAPADYNSESETSAKQWLFYRAMYACMYGNDGLKKGSDNKISAQALNSGSWFSTSKKGVGYAAASVDGLDGNDGTVECADSDLVTGAVEALGFASGVDMFCAINEHESGTYYTPNGGDNNCANSDSFTVFGNGVPLAEGFKIAVMSKTNSPPNEAPRSMLYWLNKRSLEVFCGGGKAINATGTSTTANSSRVVPVDYVDVTTNKITRANYQLVLDETRRIDDVYYTPSNRDNAADKTCEALAGDTLSYSRDFARYMETENTKAIRALLLKDLLASSKIKKAQCGDSPGAACLSTLKNELSRIVNGCSPNSYTEPIAYDKAFNEISACVSRAIDASNVLNNASKAAAKDVSANTNSETPTNTSLEDLDSDSSSCAVQGIGWVVCPVITFIGELNDQAFNLLSKFFLETESSLIQDKDTFKAWEAFRDIANVMFVIAFVAIVYAQMIGGRN